MTDDMLYPIRPDPVEMVSHEINIPGALPSNGLYNTAHSVHQIYKRPHANFSLYSPAMMQAQCQFFGQKENKKCDLFFFLKIFKDC